MTAQQLYALLFSQCVADTGKKTPTAQDISGTLFKATQVFIRRDCIYKLKSGEISPATRKNLLSCCDFLDLTKSQIKAIPSKSKYRGIRVDPRLNIARPCIDMSLAKKFLLGKFNPQIIN